MPAGCRQRAKHVFGEGAEHCTRGAYATLHFARAPLQKKKLEIRFQEPELNATIPADSFSQQKPAHVQEIPIEMIGS